MPCRDYESDNWENYNSSREAAKLKKQADKLARIACKAMEALEQNGIEDFLILKDPEVAQWWKDHKEADRKERARVAEIERKERVKAEALASLSDEAKELLGLAPKKAQKKARVAWSDIKDEDEDEQVAEMYEEDLKWEVDETTLPDGMKVYIKKY